MAGSDRYHEKETDDRDAAGRRAGLAAGASDEGHGEAGGTVWRPISHHRLSAVQLHEFRHRYRGRAHAVSAIGAEQLHRLRSAVGS